MNNSFSDSYKNAGVDVTAGYRSVELIKKHTDKTKIPGVLEGIGGFGGLFELSKTGYKEPVLVSGTDGVGTKLKIAMLMDKHDTIGIDCVAMCVNDIICAGAKPLFFLDYIAIGKNKPEKIEQIVSGVAQGCVLSNCALVGGETAEHPGMMAEDDYDIAGFSVGIAEKSKIPEKRNVKNNDVIIALASSGVHSNGFSLTRKVFNINNNPDILHKYSSELGRTLGETLLTPTRIYVKSILTLFEKLPPLSVFHITGGGFQENIPRAFTGVLKDENLGALIKKETIQIPEIFKLIAAQGNVPERDMFNTYNMGVGMCVITRAENADETVKLLNSSGENAYIIGEVRKDIAGVLIV